MKIRIPERVLMPTLQVLGPTMVRLWIGSTRQEVTYLDPAVQPVAGRFPQSAIYVIWHESVTYPIYKFGGPGSTALVSESKDGEIIARIASGLGWQMIRGSSSRGAIRALRQSIDRCQQSDGVTVLAIAGDGPRGPRRQLKAGALYLAAKTGLPVVPAAFVYRSCWRLRSWDRLMLPRPFSRLSGLVGNPVYVSADVSAERLETLRADFEATLSGLYEQLESPGGSPSVATPAATDSASAAA